MSSDLTGLFEGEQEWVLAQASRQGSPLIIRFNSTAGDWLGHPELPIKLGFAVPLNHPNPGGLPHPDENDQIEGIEDAIIEEVAARATGVQVLAVTTGEMKEFIFYIAPGADIAAMHQTVQQRVSSHEVQCMAIHEPDWETYQRFTPG